MKSSPNITDVSSAPAAGVAKHCLHERFEFQAKRTPDAPAVSQGNQVLTYRELNEQANQLAHYLRALGVSPEMPVALYLERTPAMVVAILGVLKAGAPYVPIDLSYPKDRAAFMLQDAAAKVLITEAKLRDTLESGSARIVNLDADAPLLAQQPRTNPLTNSTDQNAAYIIYTSGSTGKPKGVVVTHHNVTRLLDQTAHWYGFNAKDVWPLFHSYAFDVSVWELWGSLLNGARLVVVPYLVTRSPSEFYRLLSHEKITVLNQTPSAFRQLIWAEQNAAEKLPLCVRYVICAGEALELQSLRPWFDLHGDETPKIVNMYGITETTVHSTFRIICREDLDSGVGSVIGVPIPDLRIYLVDEDLKPVAKGTPGEICVGGAGVARGYLNRPDLNRLRFLPDPFSDEPGARMYRSGDLAQYGPTGELEYLGRMDHQVKIRGFRVELGEIESALNKHPGIRESVVLARDSSVGDKRLVAYVVPREQMPDITALRDYLSLLVPDYMVPAQYVSLPRFPLTTNGKIDRRALPAPDSSRPNLRSEFVAPRNPTETTLARVWSHVLDIQEVGVNDNLFELGGDSIRSIRILAEAQRELSVELTLEHVFQNPTVAGLAACAEGLKKQTQASASEPFSLVSAEDYSRLPEGLEDAYPVAALQLGMFYRNELNAPSAIYHDVFSYRVRCRFDEDKMKRALQNLVDRHPVLRTSFDLATFSEPLQLVHRKGTVAPPFGFEDLRLLSPEQQSNHLVCWIEGEKRRPFQRTVPPLARFHVLWLADDAFQFIFSFHHCCLDGWSLAAVVTEVFKDYTAFLENMEAGLTAPTAFYRDFVALERAAGSDPGHREFWSKQLEDTNFTPLPRWPASHCTGGLEQARGPEKHVPADVLAGLRLLAQAAGVPLKTVLLAAHMRVMSLNCGTADVLTGLISNGRPERHDGDRIAGLFLNAVPFRQRLESGSWLDLVKETFAQERAVMPFRRFPLAQAQRLAGSQRLFETAFDFVHFHVYKSLQGRQDINLAEGHYFEANDMTTYTTFMLDASSTSLEIHIDYDPNFLCREQVNRLTDHYLVVLQAMASEPAKPYADRCPLSPAESHQQRVEWNDTREEYPSNETIHALFEQQARKTPDAIAVSQGAAVLTYGQLNDRAESIADYLRRAGAMPGKLVGVYLERSVEMLAALLGVLKSGAAYVPLDPAYPAERLAFMAQDAGLEIILTQSSLSANAPKEAQVKVVLEEVRDVETKFSSPAVSANSRDLAYVIYTSGSTGKPKGVQVEHRSVVNLLLSAARRTKFGACENLLAVTTLSFDIAGLELFMPLLTGARIALASTAEASDPSALSRLMQSSNCTFMQATPATWRMLIESGWGGATNLRVITGGEALKPDLAAQLLERVQEVWNFYGPTETTIWSTACRILPGETPTIGCPLANTQAYILNSKRELLPAGAIGELYLGGDGVARGYLNRPELTAERFVPNPYSRSSSDREIIYRTGDLARWLPDGRIECLGRIDHQVKIRGFRIEPGEIEAVLKQHPGVAQAVVTAREDTFGEKKLVGYMVSRNGPISAGDLRDFTRERLPAHMVPSHFVMLPSLPLTPNGKLDMRRLPAPDAATADRPYVAPRDATENALEQIWREVLDLQRVGVTDNIFDLGADSLSATRAYARMNRLFGAQLTLPDVFQHPTIESLKKVLGAQSGTRSSTPAIKAQPRVI